MAVGVLLGLAVTPRGGPAAERSADSRRPAAGVIGPGLSTIWFDEEPPPDVARYLRRQLDLPENSRAPVTAVQCVKLDAAGSPISQGNRVTLGTGWAYNFQFEQAYRDWSTRGVQTVVALQPGPAPAALVAGCKSAGAAAWLSEHAHDGGTLGSVCNEPVIQAAILAASQLGTVTCVGGHSQFGLNLLGLLAKRPEILGNL